MSRSDSNIKIEDRSVRNSGNMGDVNTGNINQPPLPPKGPRVFSSYILPAIIAAVGAIVAALIAVYLKH